MKQINFTRLSETAQIPLKAHYTDAGFDLFADEDIVLPIDRATLVSTSIAIEIPEGYVGLIWPRSGLAVKEGIDVMAGVIDCGYSGEVKVCLIKHSSHDLYWECDGNSYQMNQDGNYTIRRGDRIAQIIIQPIPNFYFTEVEEFAKTERGTRGFGSTGTKSIIADEYPSAVVSTIDHFR